MQTWLVQNWWWVTGVVLVTIVFAIRLRYRGGNESLWLRVLYAADVASILEVVGFAVIALIGIFFGAVAFYRALGVFGAIWALTQLRSREIPVGIEGHPPSFHLRGIVGVVVSLVLAVAFVATAWFAPEVECYLSE